MIDCVFLLMVYFLWSSSFAAVEMALPSSLSAQTRSSAGSANRPPPPEADFENIVIRVVAVGGKTEWDINGSPAASLDDLRQTLTTIVRIKRDAPVVIDPVGDVPLGEVIDVFDLTRLVGFEKVQFATEAPGSR
jgi:biopolymer transport protein ExbD